MTVSLSPTTAAASDYRSWVARVQLLAGAVRQLESRGAEMGLPAPAELNWHGELFGKLLPQLQQSPFLIVAVTGGTNTGKSVVFNHLAGGQTSRAHPNATQTRHPVCSVPRGFLADHDLAQIFPDFELRTWQSENDALEEGPDNRLIVREDPGGTQPARLLLLDTPDIDGVLKENWKRADLVRHAADVLVCVLTQQKYNDASIRDFFRAAAEADKSLLVVFNMVHWPRQRELCAGWLNTFCAETGSRPLQVYAAPLDHEAADEQRLPFFALSPGATDPRQDLAELRFDAIKIRSFQGSLRDVLDPQRGLPAYLRQIEQRSSQYSEARELLSKQLRLKINDLPQLSRRLVWDEIWKWLEQRRTRFERTVNGFYTAVGSVVTRWFSKSPQQELSDSIELEWDSLRLALASLLDQLDLLRRGGNDVVRAALGEMLSGEERARLFDDLRARHQALPLLGDDYVRFIRAELDKFAVENPKLLKFIQWGLVSAAIVRPAISITLFSVGAYGADVAAGHAAGHIVGDLLVGTAATVTGEGLFSGAKVPLATLLSRLFAGYYAQRADLLAGVLHDHVLGAKVAQLQRLAQLDQNEPFQAARRLVADLSQEMSTPSLLSSPIESENLS